MGNIKERSTEEKIVQAAEKIFVRDGYDGARMKDIAEEAGINKALLHYYFRSKANLFEKILHSKLSAFLPQVTMAVKGEASIHDKFEGLVDGYLNMLQSNPQLPMFILFSIYRNPDFAQRLPREIFTTLIAFFKKAMRAKQLKRVDPEHLLINIMSMCVFPYVARPMATHMMGKTTVEYNDFLAKRKKEILKVLHELVEKPND